MNMKPSREQNPLGVPSTFFSCKRLVLEKKKYRETCAVKNNQTHEISDSCSFLRDGGETTSAAAHPAGDGSCSLDLPRAASSSVLCPALTPVEGIGPGAAPSGFFEHPAHVVSVWCCSLIYFCKYIVLSTVTTSKLAPSDTEKEQLQEATSTARINSAFHSSRHARKIVLQGSPFCTTAVLGLQTK